MVKEKVLHPMVAGNQIGFVQQSWTGSLNPRASRPGVRTQGGRARDTGLGSESHLSFPLALALALARLGFLRRHLRTPGERLSR